MSVVAAIETETAYSDPPDILVPLLLIAQQQATVEGRVDPGELAGEDAEADASDNAGLRGSTGTEQSANRGLSADAAAWDKNS